MMTEHIKTPQEINQFWIKAGFAKWFVKDNEFDELIKRDFFQTLTNSIDGKLQEWQNKPDTILALIILLDQFSRNIFRGKPQTFENDHIAVKLTKLAVNKKFDQKLPKEIEMLKMFMYMPLMHSEKIEDQEECLRLMKNANLKNSVKSSIEHRDAIKRFGRFPHRNQVLGRKSTKEEIEFLKNDGLAP